MKTRDALFKLSGGVKKYENINGDLLANRSKFIDMYEAREREIVEKKLASNCSLPFIEAIKKKVIKAVNSPDSNLPIVTRFDLYTGVKKASDRSNDVGLKRLSSQLERAWHADPLGTLSYGDVSGLIGLYKDQYPMSKAADAIEAECTRVGLHKLPVAKLARLATNINSQSDYDTVVEVNGYAGDRSDQIRARALLRELVELKNVNIKSERSNDSRTSFEKVTDKLASLDKNSQIMPPVSDPLHEMMETPEEEELEHELGVEVNPQLVDQQDDVSVENVEDGADIMEEIEDVAQDVIDEAPEDAQDFVDHEMAEGHHTAPPGTAEWGAQEVLEEGHKSAPPSDQWLEEELNELETGSPVGDESMDMNAKAPPGKEDLVLKLKKQYPGEPEKAFATAWSVHNKGKQSAKSGCEIPLPDGEIDSQPNSDSLVDLPSDGGKVLKSSYIENAVLDGRTIKSKSGSFKILINDNNEVELWNKSAGRACDLINLDVAISDFINLVNHEKRAAKITAARNATVDLVSVPCSRCAKVTKFAYTASNEDKYACLCGNLIESSLVNDLVKLGALSIEKVSQQLMQDSQYGNIAQRLLESAPDLNNWEHLTKMVMEEGEKDPNIDPDRLLQWVQIEAPKMQQGIDSGNMFEFSGRKAQLAPSMPPSSAPGNEGNLDSEEEPVTDMPIDEVIKGAFVNYKAQGMSLPESLRTFFKEHEDLVEQKWDDYADSILIGVQKQYFTSDSDVGADMPEVAQPPEMAQPPELAQPSKLSAQKVMEPAVRKQKDSISVNKQPLGKDTEQSSDIPSTSVKSQPGKPDGKLSPTDLGHDTDSDDVKLPMPKSSPSKFKLPNKKLNKDTEPNDPFSVPGLGSTPSVKK